MRFHWMDRGESDNSSKIKKLAEELEEYGYYSLLLTYHSKQTDLLTKSLLAADKNIKLKFLIHSYLFFFSLFCFFFFLYFH